MREVGGNLNVIRDFFAPKGKFAHWYKKRFGNEFYGIHHSDGEALYKWVSRQREYMLEIIVSKGKRKREKLKNFKPEIKVIEDRIKTEAKKLLVA